MNIINKYYSLIQLLKWSVIFNCLVLETQKFVFESIEFFKLCIDFNISSLVSQQLSTYYLKSFFELAYQIHIVRFLLDYQSRHFHNKYTEALILSLHRLMYKRFKDYFFKSLTKNLQEYWIDWQYLFFFYFRILSTNLIVSIFLSTDNDLYFEIV